MNVCMYTSLPFYMLPTIYDMTFLLDIQFMVHGTYILYGHTFDNVPHWCIGVCVATTMYHIQLMCHVPVCVCTIYHTNGIMFFLVSGYLSFNCVLFQWFCATERSKR